MQIYYIELVLTYLRMLKLVMNIFFSQPQRTFPVVSESLITANRKVGGDERLGNTSERSRLC